MKLDISVKYLLKSLIPSLIILTVFYLEWKDNQENARMFYAFIGCIISAITFPFFNEDNTENGNKVYRERILAKRLLYKSSWRKLNCNI
ncbi:hypothetical protein [Escherichia coli]|uniref:hypothetical protein n=1 Tax=Escherichia coli TaxID=562 RepID=UPI00201AEABE|nr:hypothetical protein [Escherichia coli]